MTENMYGSESGRIPLGLLLQMSFGGFGDYPLISAKASFYEPTAIVLGHRVRIDDFCVLVGGLGITIGDDTHLSAGAQLHGGAAISIGKDCIVSGGAAIWSVSNDYGKINPKAEIRGRVIIEDGCRIGANAVVLPGVHLAARATVAAGAVVRPGVEIEALEIWGGVPAKHIGDRK